MLLIRLIRESYLFALQGIIANKLRTLLSLLGITIGIFAVITVFTIVDSMESTIRKNIESLGDNVLFVEKWPWSFGSDYPWWKYMNRPVTTYEEMEELQQRLSGAQAVSFMLATTQTVKYQEKSLENTAILCVSQDYNQTMSMDITDGRYFAPSESAGGKGVAIIGATVASDLFPGSDPLNKTIKVFGRNVEVIGVLKKEGEGMFGNSPDNQLVVPVSFVQNILDTRWEGYSPMIIARARPGISNDELRDELTGVMRSIRKLKPGAEENFAINETSVLTKGFEELFSIIAIAGWIIGGFSLLVGGFGIANIMFVSVRERTPVIGIQKSLGAKRYFILLEFLFEAVFLSLLGGAVGLLLVWLGTLLVSSGLDMDLSLTGGNIMLGFSVSFFIGLVSGFIPAFIASRMDPVVAIRAGG